MPSTGASESRGDLAVAGLVLAWITVVLTLDRYGIWTQRLAGLATAALLLGLLRREGPLVRAQVAVVVVLATAVEYTAAPLLGVYEYRLGNVPAYVPPGHGLVYLSALAIGRTSWFFARRRVLAALVLAGGGAWAAYGLFLAERRDVLGAFWYASLVGFLWLGRSRTFYIAAFFVITYLELLGTRTHAWTWQEHDPTGWIPIGDPPSGVAGGYGWFDLAALWLAPTVVGMARRRRGRIAACR